MNRISLIFLLALILGLTACGRGNSVNGHTMRTAYRSVKVLKERLPPENRVEFEVAFWSIRDAKASEGEFLDAVDGKSAFEVIEMGKEIYQERKSQGFKGYDNYKSWEEMIAKFDKERIDQDKRPGSTKRETSRKNGTILYNLQVPNR